MDSYGFPLLNQGSLEAVLGLPPWGHCTGRKVFLQAEISCYGAEYPPQPLPFHYMGTVGFPGRASIARRDDTRFWVPRPVGTGTVLQFILPGFEQPHTCSVVGFQIIDNLIMSSNLSILAWSS